MTPICSVETKWMRRPCSVSRAFCEPPASHSPGERFLNLEAFAPSTEWEFISKDAREGVVAGGSNDLQLHAD